MWEASFCGDPGQLLMLPMPESGLDELFSNINIDDLE